MELIISRPAANASDYPATDVCHGRSRQRCQRLRPRPRPAPRRRRQRPRRPRRSPTSWPKVSDGPAVDVQLVLAPGRHVVQGDPVALSFALSGILAAQLRAADDSDDGLIAVTTAADAHGVRVTISSNGIPPLEFVRAVAGDGSANVGDPTLAHCRRLIEGEGGRLCLIEQAGRIAMCVMFPAGAAFERGPPPADRRSHRARRPRAPRRVNRTGPVFLTPVP